MKWEENEIIQILSKRQIHPRKEQNCILCSIPLYPQDKCYSFGIVDRKDNTLSRIYTCEEHNHLFSSTVEDLLPHEQRFLFENRYCLEIWCEE